MPGHDKSKIVGHNPNDLDEFVCGICQDVLDKPVVTQCCRQSYCRQCIEEWLKGHQTCPNDSQPLTTNGLSEVPRLVINFIDKMKIRCDYSDKGCPEVTTIGTRMNHLKICMYNKRKTSDDAFLAYFMKRNLELSEMNDKLIKEKMSIENERDELLASRPNEEVNQYRDN